MQGNTMMYGGVLTPNLPAAPPDQLSDGSSGLLQRRQTLTPLHSSSNANATVLGNRLRQPPPGLTSGAASVAGPQPEARAKAASLAQTYMPVTRSDLRQFVRTRAETPQQLAEEGGSQPSAVERPRPQLRPVSAVGGSRLSAARNEAASIVKCYERFVAEGTDPQVALHAARAHAITVRQRSELAEAQRRRMHGERAAGPAPKVRQADVKPAEQPAEARKHEQQQQQPPPPPAAAQTAASTTPARPRSSRPKSASRTGCRPNDALLQFGYTTLGPIAQGAFSQVNRARHLQTSREVAVKTFLMKIKGGRRPDVETVKTELSCLQRLQESGHRHVANLLALFESTHETHAILVYCSGGTLLRHLQSRGHGVGLDEETSTSIVTQVGDALAHMHELGVTHRDVKPGNVVYDNTERETVRLVDFGFSQLHKATNEYGATESRKLKTICGSPAYMAPELNKGQPYLGPPVDVWALGCLAYELLHNRPAFRGQSMQDLNVRILKGNHDKVASSASKHMRKLIEKKALVVDVAQRASAADIVEFIKDRCGPQDSEPDVPRVGKSW